MTPTPNPQTPTPNKRQLAKARTRDLVLQTAAQLFGEVGYEAATIRAIAKRAGMSTGAVFAHFFDKADLYLEVFGHPPLTPEQGRDLLRAALAGDAEAGLRIGEDIAAQAARLRQERETRPGRVAQPPADPAHAVREAVQ